MKKCILIPLAMALLLGACSPSTALRAGSATTTERAAQLAQGTLNLEGTDQAVNAEQAQELAPLWEILADLSVSATAAPEELAATVEAIEAGMTAKQLDAIGAMDVETAEAAGMIAAEAPAAAASGGDAAAMEAAQRAMEPSLGGEMGRDMASGVGGDLGGGMPPEPGQAQVGSSPGVGVASSSLFQRVITLLQEKAQG
jgi:hypothetical protein